MARMKPTQRDLVYTDVGHPLTKAEAKRRHIKAFWLPRGEDDIIYGKVGESHGMTPWGDYRYSDIMGRVDQGNRIISVASVGRVDSEAAQARLDYAVSILAMDWPGYEIYWFGSGGSQRLGQRLRNPRHTTPMVFIGSCPQFTGRLTAELIAAVQSAQQVTRRTFLRYVDNDEMQHIEAQLGYDRRLPMSSDPRVGYYKSTFYGYPIVFFDWSAMEYIFGPQELAGRKPRRIRKTPKLT